MVTDGVVVNVADDGVEGAAAVAITHVDVAGVKVATNAGLVEELLIDWVVADFIADEETADFEVMTEVVVVDGVAEVLIFELGGEVADVMVDDDVVDEVTTDAAVDDVVFGDLVFDEMVIFDVFKVVVCVAVVVLAFDEVKHTADGLLVGLASKNIK